MRYLILILAPLIFSGCESVPEQVPVVKRTDYNTQNTFGQTSYHTPQQVTKSYKKEIPMDLDYKVDAFIKEAMPEVYRTKAQLFTKYRKSIANLKELGKTKAKLNSEKAIALCTAQEEVLENNIKKLETAIKDINVQIENAYAKYEVLRYSDSDMSYEEIATMSNDILSDIEYAETTY